MTHASLFSGIGGFDLAAQWMGWENIFHCEKDPFCRRVLNYYWPESTSYEDITTADFTIYRGRIDVLTGGFPCQPHSTAGKREGEKDDRHLWPYMVEAIRQIRPRYVVGENVHGIISSSKGVVFEQVHSNLEAEGYEVETFLLPAAGVNAPHQRYRFFFVAHASIENDRRDFCQASCGRKSKFGICSISDDDPNPSSTRREQLNASPFANNEKYGSWICDANVPDTECLGRVQSNEKSEPKFTSQDIPDWRSFPTQSPLCDGDDGLPTELDGITISRHRRETIKAGGNAIVPQLGYHIFKSIAEVDCHFA